jgi:hypothetical protein
MPIFRVLATRTEFYSIEAFFRVANRDDAEIAFFEGYEEQSRALRWHQDYDGSDSEIEGIEDVTDTHAPDPEGMERRVCRLCGRPVRWTGMPAERSPTGRTIPGPWEHIDNPLLEFGIGL